ncbi:hypothetical protein Pyn_07854 [Prunus yedoensis var. nudiflora]|uniref:Uncharacterized protein n=1 Tax=Prunus yedoensis var. nudiflora TaxID=2094558 RepID=A0A314ZJE5_PRUYE|nr:hypothetical protein Pyn_07854 [Prunus yedoensis var. nudiflora]
MRTELSSAADQYARGLGVAGIAPRPEEGIQARYRCRFHPGWRLPWGTETHKLQWSETASLIPSWINMPMQFTMDECLVQGSYLVLVFDLVCLRDVEKIFQGSNRLAYVLWS